MSFWSDRKKHNQKAKERSFTERMTQVMEDRARTRDIVFQGQRPDTDDYGYSITNPICTSSINYSDKYLTRLRSSGGEEVSWIRQGSTCLTKCNGAENIMVDTYLLYLNGCLYKEIHICPYGHSSSYVPKGFSLANEDDSRGYGGDIAREARDKGISPEVLIRIRKLEYNVRIERKMQEDAQPIIVTEAENARQTNPSSCHKCGKKVIVENDNPDERTDRQKVGKIMGCDIYNLSSIDNLAISTVLSAKNIQGKDAESFLCSSDISCCDTVFFACFILRALCLGASGNRGKAIKFSDDYITKVKVGTKNLYKSVSDCFEEFFDNRMAFYDRIFASKVGIENKLKALLEEFEIILKSDAINNGYEPFSEKSPLPILNGGIFDDIKCQAEVHAFFNTLPVLVSPYYEQVQQYLK